MANNVYKFRKVRQANPERFKLIRLFERRRLPSRDLSGLVVLCIAVSFDVLQGWPKCFDGLKSEPYAAGPSEPIATIRTIASSPWD